MELSPTIQYRLKKRLSVKDDCLVWTGATNKFGYGKIYNQAGWLLTHRVAYFLEYGDIPQGFLILHSCDNPPCCKPEHLTLGTYKDNNQDCINKGRSIRVSGEQHHKAVLTTSDVQAIRSSTSLTQKELAQQYKVSRQLIGRIIRNEIWR